MALSHKQSRWEYDVNHYARMLTWVYMGVSDHMCLYAIARMGEIRHRYPNLSKVFDQMDKETEQSNMEQML